MIDFGSGSGPSELTLKSMTAASHLPVEIWNWSNGANKLIITDGFTGSSPFGALDISFFSGGQGSTSLGTAKFVSGSSGELVPVPEASTLLGVLGLMAPLAWRERRHWMRCRAARG